MRTNRICLVVTVAAATITTTIAAGSASAASPHYALKTLVTGLDNPRHLAPSTTNAGGLVVAEAGHGGNGPCAADPEAGKACVGRTGRVSLVTAAGHRSTLVSGLSSVAGKDGTAAGGPAAVVQLGNGNLVVAIQDTGINKKGGNPFGKLGSDLGKVEVLSSGHKVFVFDLAKYEATHNPDHGRGAPGEPPIDSDPYALAFWNGGIVAADAAGNDLLFLSPQGKISTLFVFPTQGKGQNTIQSVPTSIAVGSDNALYVGELASFAPGKARIWRITGAGKGKVFSSGYTTISALAFDSNGSLLATEITTNPASQTAPGALVRVSKNGKSHTTLVSNGLLFPTGVAVVGGKIYVSNFGIAPATGVPGPAPKGGEIVQVVPQA